MRSALVILVTASLIASCSGKTTTSASGLSPANASGDLSMSLSFAPSPPKQGSETITVVVKDSSNNPVKGARLTLATRMPAMTMAGPSLTPQDNGDGTYSAVINLNYGTKWVFHVVASADGKSGKAEFTQEIP